MGDFSIFEVTVEYAETGERFLNVAISESDFGKPGKSAVILGVRLAYDRSIFRQSRMRMLRHPIFWQSLQATTDLDGNSTVPYQWSTGQEFANGIACLEKIGGDMGGDFALFSDHATLSGKITFRRLDNFSDARWLDLKNPQTEAFLKELIRQFEKLKKLARLTLKLLPDYSVTKSPD